MTQPQAQKLHKILAQSGLGSRRDMETLIEDGQVFVNGEVATVGTRIVPTDVVKVGRRIIQLNFSEEIPRVLLYYKPEGEIVSRDDPQGRPSVFSALPRIRGSKWINIGRLDFNTSGLLIFTNNGDLANRLMHPSFDIEREYAVRLVGEMSEENLKQSCKEILLEDGPAQFEWVRDMGGEGTNHWYQVAIKEGRNREVRRMFESMNLMVSRLLRTRFGIIQLPPRLKRGQFLELKPEQVKQIIEWVGISKPMRVKQQTKMERDKSYTPGRIRSKRSPKETTSQTRSSRRRTKT
ncbi:pseudouridine synthase [Ferrovum sp. PN-J185]|uniref:23S rRNA pseudouridine(2605) synthase RluB n=1 Tax=Ferrovum sp. PN-J185 TaxID=1356306 RepID=UPI00079C14D6|nr:pseudouridine synthase [Ferrovum sp. PN-J185]KXW56288.1 ribosomal large subunit pseudouridine synthase B [Ferrovum sp. PN-J185]MCC6069012.1 pseudouridine synthase [Ferrovum sp. PN-J185]MDE1891008.1 pseudouridine synthase [Betaproteobacteria bacterium]MDE2055680.1 pseudouridine synthase [Betaproteobacteria bacterium]